MAAYPDPPPVIPVPESLAAQGPYIRLSCPGLARARNVSRHWGPPVTVTQQVQVERRVGNRSESFGLWRVRFPPCLVRPAGRRLPVQGLQYYTVK